MSPVEQQYYLKNFKSFKRLNTLAFVENSWHIALQNVQLNKLCLNCILLPIGEGNGTQLQYSCLENPMDGGAWQATVHGVSKSRTRLSNFTFTSLSSIGEGNGNPLQCSCLENPRDRGAWWAAIYGVAESDTTEATQQQQHILPVFQQDFFAGGLSSRIDFQSQVFKSGSYLNFQIVIKYLETL